MIFWLCVFLILALAAYNGVVYVRASGTTAQRIAAAWQGSMTIATAIWLGFVSALNNGLDALAQITGDPNFATVGAAIKSAVPASAAPWVVIVTLLLPIVGTVIARKRTLPPTPPTPAPAA